MKHRLKYIIRKNEELHLLFIYKPLRSLLLSFSLLSCSDSVSVLAVFLIVLFFLSVC